MIEESRADGRIMVQVVLPSHLRILAGTGRSVEVALGPIATLGELLDAIEEQFPAIAGTIRDPATGRRRPLLRFFVGQEDFSELDPNSVLPESVLTRQEPFVVIGSIAGGWA